MKIQREDVERIKELARKVSVTRDPVAIHEMETGFKFSANCGGKEKSPIFRKLRKPPPLKGRVKTSLPFKGWGFRKTAKNKNFKIVLKP